MTQNLGIRQGAELRLHVTKLKLVTMVKNFIWFVIVLEHQQHIRDKAAAKQLQPH